MLFSPILAITRESGKRIDGAIWSIPIKAYLK